MKARKKARYKSTNFILILYSFRLYSEKNYLIKIKIDKE